MSNALRISIFKVSIVLQFRAFIVAFLFEVVVIFYIEFVNLLFESEFKI